MVFSARHLALGTLVLVMVIAPSGAEAIPRIDLSIGGGDASGPTQISSALKVLAALTVLSLAPAILMLMTSFTRIVIVLNFVKQSLGVQGMPPNQVIVGMSLILTFFVMTPVGTKIHSQALQPYMEGKITEEVAMERGLKPLRRFMLDHTRNKDLELFVDIAAIPRPSTPEQVPMSVLIPSFVLSELTLAFHMGFLIFIPFILLDFILASILMSMGMVMLPPALISLPLKVMLFVLVDGWYLVIGSLVRSYA